MFRSLICCLSTYNILCCASQLAITIGLVWFSFSFLCCCYCCCCCCTVVVCLRAVPNKYTAYKRVAVDFVFTRKRFVSLGRLFVSSGSRFPFFSASWQAVLLRALFFSPLALNALPTNGVFLLLPVRSKERSR